MYGIEDTQKFLESYIREYTEKYKSDLDSRISDLENKITEIKNNGVKDVYDNLDTIKYIADHEDTFGYIHDNEDIIVKVGDNVDNINNYYFTYLGPKKLDPTTRNNGSDLRKGDLYFNTINSNMRVYTGSEWEFTCTSSSAIMNKQVFLANGTTKKFIVPGGYDTINVEVRLNGVTLVNKSNTYGSVDTSSGSYIEFDYYPEIGDVIEVITWMKFKLNDTYTQAIINRKQVSVSTEDVSEIKKDDFLAKVEKVYYTTGGINIELPNKDVQDYDTVVIIDYKKQYSDKPVNVWCDGLLIDDDDIVVKLDKSGTYKFMYLENSWRVL